MTRAVVVLDANVLYPIRVCDFILTASSLQLLARPIVTAEIIDEAQRNITADRPDLGRAKIERRFNAVRAVTDGHDQPVPGRHRDMSIINDKDRHVLAAALHHNAHYIITNDTRLRTEITAWLNNATRDKPRPISANQMAVALIDEGPDAVAAVVAAMAARMQNPSRTPSEVAAALAPEPSCAQRDPLAQTTRGNTSPPLDESGHPGTSHKPSHAA
jgi:rRNA-processing protein FCF1